MLDMRPTVRSTAPKAALVGLVAACALALPRAAFAQRPEFEVASVKANRSNEFPGFAPRRSGGSISWHNTQIYSLIYYAYHLDGSYQIVSYPDLPDPYRWWDIDARTSADATEDQVRLMFQSLLEDRFKLRVHRETRDVPEYELTVGKGKPKLAPSSADKPMTVAIEDRTFSPPAGGCGTTLWLSGALMACHAVSMEKIAAEVRGALKSPLVDHTGLEGTYDLKLLYMPDGREPQPDQTPAPTLSEALSDLGLKLQKTKGPVDVLVIDHMEKASEN